jgi:hypothetical protein
MGVTGTEVMMPIQKTFVDIELGIEPAVIEPVQDNDP